MLTVEMPWPSKNLHPNARVHYMARAKATKSHRRAGYFLTLAAARNVHASAFPERVPVRLTFHPPDNRQRDRDGMLSAVKAYLDGVADALGVNDSRFDLQAPRVLDPVKGGKVIVEIGE